MDREKGLEYTNMLLGLNKGSFKSYIDNWKAIQRESKKISDQYYNSEAKTMTKKLTTTYAKQMKTEFGSINKLMGGLGKNAVKGLLKGMTSQTKNLSGVSKSIANSIVKSFRKTLKIKSPSRETMSIGINLDLGLVKGIDASKRKVLKTVDAFGQDVLSRMQQAVALETGNINASATLRANYGQAIVVNSETKGDVYLDNQKVGRVITPVVSKTLKKAGVK